MVIDDPDINPSSLRFQVDDVVLFKSAIGWFEGEVIEVCPRVDLGDGERRVIPYLVLPYNNDEDSDEPEFVLEDSNEYIQPRQEDLSPDPARFKPCLPVPDDPYSYLYTGMVVDSYDESGKSIAEEIAKSDFVESAKLNPDGSINVKGKDGNGMTTAILEIPQGLVLGIPGHVAIQMGMQILQRRRADSNNSSAQDPIGALKSAAPQESSLGELEKLAKLSNEKMLQLADALMYGFYGWPRDPMRACNCYEAAAWGCSEEEEISMIGLAVGSPEAMIAKTYVILSSMKQEFIG